MTGIILSIISSSPLLVPLSLVTSLPLARESSIVVEYIKERKK